jgi:hypothetical protein
MTKLAGGGKPFAELLLALRAHAERRAGKKTDDAVTRRIAEDGRAEFVERLVLAAIPAHGADCVGVGFQHFVDRGVEQQRQVRFAQDVLQQDRVEDDGVALAVPVKVLDEQFVDHAAFARPPVVVAHVGGRAEDPEPDFAGGVTAEDGPVLDERDLDTRPCGGDGATDTGHAPADDHQVGLVTDGAQCSACGCGFTDHGVVLVSVV